MDTKFPQSVVLLVSREGWHVESMVMSPGYRFNCGDEVVLKSELSKGMDSATMGSAKYVLAAMEQLSGGYLTTYKLAQPS
jgi:hypothetical protein